MPPCSPNGVRVHIARCTRTRRAPLQAEGSRDTPGGARTPNLQTVPVAPNGVWRTVATSQASEPPVRRLRIARTRDTSPGRQISCRHRDASSPSIPHSASFSRNRSSKSRRLDIQAHSSQSSAMKHLRISTATPVIECHQSWKVGLRPPKNRESLRSHSTSCG